MTRRTNVAAAPDPRAPLAAFLSFLFPGLGQAYNGQAALGWLLAAPALLIVLLALLALMTARSATLSRFLDARFLVALILLDAALLGWRLVAIAQAHGWRERLLVRRWTTAVTAVLVVATLAMHVVPAYYAAKAIDTIGAVALQEEDLHDGTPSDRGGLGSLPEPSTQPDVMRGERVNVLLVGVDSAPNRTTELTDTMMVVSLDPDGGRSAMLSIPRDLYGAPLPDGRVFNAKLNSLMAYANRRPQEFPDGGVAALKQTIGLLLGVDIHYFAAINLLGFKQAVDAIGGVDITVEREINDPTYRSPSGTMVGLFLQPGRYHMDGEMALAFVRSRKGVGDSDFTRADRQQQLLAAIREKLTAGNLLLALPGLLDAVKNTIATDVPSARIPALAQAVQDADMSRLQRAVIQPPLVTPNPSHPTAGYILVPDFDAIYELAQQLMGDLPDAAPSPAP